MHASSKKPASSHSVSGGLHHTQTALHRLVGPQKYVLATGILLFIASFILNWHGALVATIGLLTILYFADLLFNIFLISRSFTHPSEIQVSTQELKELSDDKLPDYTILCPLYKEWQVIPQFVSAIGRLDYPKDKLHVVLLLEQDDTETIENIDRFALPSYVKTIIIPDSLPKTKPKALNIGLTKTLGEYVVVYDAEDVPEPKQLKKALVAFAKSGRQTVCIQAKLNFYNPHHNILTKIFTAEYSVWFDLILTGLQSINAPIPLGGTSNHFRTRDLQLLQGWDPFNVTEDCDLGMRLAKRGYLTKVVNSTTHEEANSNMLNWLRQRSRWIKGYMQTYLVHSRTPRAFGMNLRKPHALTFQLIVGGKIISLFINPLMWLLTFTYFLFRTSAGPFIETLFPPVVLYMGVVCLVFGNFLYTYSYMIGCAKRNHYDLIKYAFFVPLYWLGMSIASWIAFYQMIMRPHYWEKTVHGLHLNHDKALRQSQDILNPALLAQI